MNKVVPAVTINNVYKAETPKIRSEAPDQAPDVSVIIVNWNLKQVLRECLESVGRFGGGLTLETIVVDNASSDGSSQMVESEFPGVKLLRNGENLGFSRANNQGMQYASGRYFFLLNNDALLKEGALPLLVSFMDEHADTGICGPRVVNEDGTLQVRSKGRFPSIRTALVHFFLPLAWQGRRGRTLGIYDDRVGTEPRTLDWVSGCALMARRQAVESVGMLDASVFMYCEDVDWCYRMHRSGWKVSYVPAAEVMHYGGRSMKQHRGMVVAAHAKGLSAFYGKYHGSAATMLFRLVLCLGYAVKMTGWILKALVGSNSGMDKIRRLFTGKGSGSG